MFDINKFIKGSDDCIEAKINVIEDAPSKQESTTKKKRAKKTNTNINDDNKNIVPIPKTSMSYIQDNIPYAGAYMETNQQLDDSINQLNILGAEIVTDLGAVRNNKTLRNKYNLINEMTQTATSIVSAKLSAIKEKNSTINNINKLELDRLKQLKTNTSEEDDNVRIANLYDAFINTPIGMNRNVLGPSAIDMMAGGANGPSLPVQTIGFDQQSWESELNPAENRMVLEAKGVIETVVMYDSNTGNRWFEIIDKNTRQPLPNVEKPDSSYIYDLDININGGYAKDNNRNVSYPLICIGNTINADMSEY